MRRQSFAEVFQGQLFENLVSLKLLKRDQQGKISIRELERFWLDTGCWLLKGQRYARQRLKQRKEQLRRELDDDLEARDQPD